MRAERRVIGIVVVAAVGVASAACGQFARARVAASPGTVFTPSAQQRQLVGYILRSTVTAAAAPLPTAAGGRVVVTRPHDYLTLYQQAAATCPGLPWTVVAAIGTVESDNGQNSLPGVHSGANFKGAEGPMQMLPRSFAAYALPVPPGGAVPPNPYDPIDAVYAATRYLCADGGAGGRNVAGAVFAYNHATWYVDEVLNLAASYARGG